MTYFLKLYVDNQAKDILNLSGFECAEEQNEEGKYCFQFKKPHNPTNLDSLIEIIKEEGTLFSIQEDNSTKPPILNLV